VIGPEERRHERLAGRSRWRWGALFACTFLTFYVAGVWSSSGSTGLKVSTTALLVVFGAVYVLVPPLVMPGSRAHQYVMLGGLLVITVVLIIVAGPSMSGLWIYVGVAAALVLPLAQTLGLAVGLAVIMLILTRDADMGVSWELAVTLIALSVWMSAFSRNIRLTAELRETRDEHAKAAVTAERERIARDLHDILGHSLTAIAVKAGLARRLVERDPAAATREIVDVERLAREALTDVRATAAGIRGTSLAVELAAAAAVLRAAGIRPVLPQAVDDVTPAGREVFGFVVREAVTNVIRHSGATTCTITLEPSRIEIADDGEGLGHQPGGGRGVVGLAERVQAAGGQLWAGPGPKNGFVVVATVGAS
jgi:two-component system sensor histidine kinase DesK